MRLLKKDNQGCITGVGIAVSPLLSIHVLRRKGATWAQKNNSSQMSIFFLQKKRILDL